MKVDREANLTQPELENPRNAAKIVLAASALALGGLGLAMVVANPNPSDYQSYAGEHLTQYLKDNACKKIPQEAGDFGQKLCQTVGGVAIDTARPQLQALIGKQTERQNFGLFSIYTTKLAIAPFPAYRFETVGILQQFYTYKSEEL
ncbi:DUF4359 domain-containing protein [Oscillatoria sp. FACHB-1406]|uniref:DUF4359 domain-containing protein n=1 Tax=Oscillatoria sp. FACHB-1406 TaxID=2692846 RepID=UPI001685722C|nr:DUF4359 domain-containing protein [Oscillatoria sp. FACHB-1406]MBD2577848.1 DUF4359 domain-containing protein [Oscillatoria sp. FACHB-1406]